MIQWRIDNHVDLILEDQLMMLRMDIIRKMAPSAHHGYTKAGRPLFIEKFGLVQVDKLLNRFTSEELIQCHIYWLECCCQRARERSRQLGKHVENFATIYDLHACKVELTKFLYVFKQAVHIDDNYYPERLGQIFLINPPMIFSILWDLAKYWLDPVTKTKIHVIKKGPETSTVLL
ncbi:unnamed protein product [Rotaria sp. Silwood1]|nr:unnamed protein product [Rotaria sp. Silwood1]CAF3797393.1 unnamed protein product [Rotaria sp. Silwood1]CAF3860424.1 unnamed protein product [Rotaria sp. Silwood1]CAF4038419.1 unnamed protein product [Rotaria sp. Silwood1]CAF4990507.1 unnamed protein product [Rotaria sp. Silwood1]